MNLVFVTPRRGFAATTGGSRDVARAGWVLPTEPGEIERTRDGGATWRTLWRGRLSFDALAVRRRLIVASGLKEPLTGRRDPWFTALRRHTLIVSRDGGRTWGRRTLPVRGPVALQLVTPRLWLAFRTVEAFAEARTALLRSDDAGRRWRRVPLPRGTQAVRFATPLVAVASARAQSCRGDANGPRMQLWRTTDGGRAWRPVAGTCVSAYSVADVDVVSPRLVFAVQADAYGERGPGVLRRSDDGGATWRTVARDRRRGMRGVRFRDRRRGMLVETADRPAWQGELMLLASTSDGGRTWVRHGIPAQALDASGSMTPSPAIAGHDVWVGHTLSGVIWHTRDEGRRWSLTTAPRFLDPGSDSFSHVLLAGRGRLVVSSGAGPVQSADGGRTWTPARWPSARDVAAVEGRGAYGAGDQARLVTATGSRRLHLPRGVRNVKDAAFANASDGVLVSWGSDDAEAPYSTHDGGGSWAPVVGPAQRPGVFGLAPGVIVDATDTAVSVTTDAGASWQTLDPDPPDEECDVSRPAALDIWISCKGAARMSLFYSGDGGLTWTRRDSRHVFDRQLSGSGGPEAWATPRSAYPAGDATSILWHTTDGGATWTQVWVSLRPGARARQVDCGIIPSGVLHDPLAGCR